MKFVTCEMSKVALAAFVLGIFSLNPMAKAYDVDDGSASGGMSQAQLSGLANNFSLKFVNDTIVMDGSIPEKCADGAQISVGIFRGSDGKSPAMHSVRFVPGNGCKDLTDDDKKHRVWLHSQELFGRAKPLADAGVDGGLCIVHNNNGGEDSCDVISNQTYDANAKKQKLLSDAEAKVKADQKAAAETATQERARKEKELIEKLNILCKSGDFAGFGQEIEAAKAFLGDVSAILAKVDGLKKKYLMDQISKAKDVDAVKDAYQAFLDAAGDAGWDTDDVTQAYASRRVDLMNAVVSDSNKPVSDKTSAIRDLASDLRDLGLMSEKIGNTSHTGKDLIGGAYFTLAGKIRDDAGTDSSKLGEAERMYRESESYGDNGMKAKVEAEIAKMYNAAAEQCISDAKEKGKGFNTCDKLAKKAKGAMDKAIKAQGHIKGDDSMEALAAMKQEKIARFGVDGYSMSVSGYGSMNMMGGSYDKEKYAAYTQAQQQFIMNMYMRQSMGAYGMTGAGGMGSGSGGSFFSN